MLILKAFLAAALVSLYAAAAPAPETETVLIVLETKITPVGTLTNYGLAPGANVTAPALNARACGSNDVKCDGAHVPPIGAGTGAGLIRTYNAQWSASRGICRE